MNWSADDASRPRLVVPRAPAPDDRMLLGRAPSHGRHLAEPDLFAGLARPTSPVAPLPDRAPARLDVTGSWTPTGAGPLLPRRRPGATTVPLPVRVRGAHDVPLPVRVRGAHDVPLPVRVRGAHDVPLPRRVPGATPVPEPVTGDDVIDVRSVETVSVPEAVPAPEAVPEAVPEATVGVSRREAARPSSAPSVGVDVLPGGVRAESPVNGDAPADSAPAKPAWRDLEWLSSLAAATWLAVVAGLTFWSVAPLAAGWQPRVVLTGSMMPSIRPGDVVMVAKVPADTVLPAGRVAVVSDPTRSSGSYVHRVVKNNDDGTFVTKGDANPSEDVPAVTPDRVMGQVLLVVPRVGLPMVWLRNHRLVPLGVTVVGTWLAMFLVLSRRPWVAEEGPETEDEASDGAEDEASDGAEDEVSDGAARGGADGAAQGTEDGEAPGDAGAIDDVGTDQLLVPALEGPGARRGAHRRPRRGSTGAREAA